ncbi:MarR family winged helix-turn-helix transcriptional regulator [Dongshaea marina]|uniref:MarR family winged helix-turn-helix transcriptional regulator n=1 Tax=Dongshaea marina TaxID=2047966 RepID=UPI00131F37F9|nr:MarR family transcriptional regulator [Dongshaea marina]
MNQQVESCDQVLRLLRRIIRSIDQHSRQLTMRYGLTIPQMLVIKEICHNQGLTLSEISRAINLSPATVKPIIDKLESRGYVVRERSCQDRRKLMLVATDKSLQFFEESPSLMQENFVEEFSKLQDWEASMILSTLQRVASMMDAEKFDAAPLLTGQSLLP